MAEPGQQYIALSQMTKGMTFDICTANWASLFDRLSQEVSSAVTMYHLAFTPTPGTVQVTFNGQPAQPGTQWDLDAANSQIVLKDPLPAAGTIIKVCYDH